MASTFGPTPLTIAPNAVVGSVARAYDVVDAPSWVRSTITSAPAASRSVAAALVASTMLVTLMLAMPAAATRDGRSSVTAPMKPTSTSPKSRIQVPSRAGVSSALNLTFAPRYFQLAPPSGLVSGW